MFIIDRLFENKITGLQTGVLDSDWYMAGANPQRTSSVSHQVDGQLTIEWYRPIEAYIPQHFQIIAVNNILYISTAKGLYALDATNGNTVWRFDTELPLGNSPTVFEGRVYVGGHDKKLYVLDASNGMLLWYFDGAQAGYSTNPLVIRDSYTNNQPVILIGNRDGNFYAIGAHGHPRQGEILWKYTMPNNSPILTSAAYKDGIVYTTAMNNRLYALVVNTNNPQGQLRWVTDQLQGDVFLAYWPVIYRDKVILVKSSDVIDEWRPGSRSLANPSVSSFSSYREAEQSDLSHINPANVPEIGNILDPLPWSGGYRVTDARYALEYLEEPTSSERSSDPTGNNRYNHKPWRRQYYVINQNDGSEFTFDSDSDGLREYLPILTWRAESGPMFPPVIGANGVAYFTAKFNRGQILGWNLDQPNYLSFTSPSSYALDEPLGFSMGGNRIYTSLCCDRPAMSFSIFAGERDISYWGGYLLNSDGRANGYDEMWYIFDTAIQRHQGSYVGARNWYGSENDGIKTTNAVFNSHGVQNPLIPHNGRLFIHRSNAIIALGPGHEQGKKSYLPINEVSTSVSSPDLNNLLENEINKMINAGHLKPGYYVQNQFHTSQNGQLPNYFIFPGDTLLVLSQAYPHLSSQTKQNLARYLREEWSMYFYPTSYATRGFNEGEKRHPIPLPPEIENEFMNIPKSTSTSGHSWQYPQHSIYGMWKYAQNVPENERPSISEIYSVARNRIQVPATSDSTVMQRKPFEINSWIAGYIGFLELYRMAGSPQQDATLANTVQTELNRLLGWRTQQFTKESWAFPSYNIQHKLDTSRNFIWLTPELADHMLNTIPDRIYLALDEYQYLNQYWFVNRFENDVGESSTQHLYNYHALFLANAYILKKPRQELIKYLDVPAFERGDLFYIQNLVVALEAPSGGTSTTTTRTSTTFTSTSSTTTTRTSTTFTSTSSTTTTRTSTITPTTTTLGCVISNPIIVSNCGGCCREGHTVTMLVNINSMQACSAATTFQIDAEGSGCRIEFVGGSMSGITSSPQLSASSVSGVWTIPRVSDECVGKTIYASYAALWQGNPGSGIRVSLSSPSQGSISFCSSTPQTPQIVNIYHIPQEVSEGDSVTINAIWNDDMLSNVVIEENSTGRWESHVVYSFITTTPSTSTAPTTTFTSTPSTTTTTRTSTSTAPTTTFTSTPSTTTTTRTSTSTTTTVANLQSIIIDHNSIQDFDRIPRNGEIDYVTKAASLRLMMRHASIGGNINNSLNCIQGILTNPDICNSFPDNVYMRTNFSFQRISGTGLQKVDDFVANVQSQLEQRDIFMFKFCFIDFPCEGDEWQYRWEYIRDRMEQANSIVNEYNAQHGTNKKIVWTTVPLLRRQGYECGDNLNNQIRSYVVQNGYILYDIADIESHDFNGNPVRDPYGNEIAWEPWCGEQQDCRDPRFCNCHPSWPGRSGLCEYPPCDGGSIRLAKGIWVLLARISGWR